MIFRLSFFFAFSFLRFSSFLLLLFFFLFERGQKCSARMNGEEAETAAAEQKEKLKNVFRNEEKSMCSDCRDGRFCLRGTEGEKSKRNENPKASERDRGGWIDARMYNRRKICFDSFFLPVSTYRLHTKPSHINSEIAQLRSGAPARFLEPMEK